LKIEPIIYETTRDIYSLEDKLSIASLILFCRKLGSKTFSQLLYTKDYSGLIADLSEEYKDYDVKLTIRLEDPQIKNALIKTIEKVREKEDADRYLEALYEGDVYAVEIEELVNYSFNNIKLKL